MKKRIFTILLPIFVLTLLVTGVLAGCQGRGEDEMTLTIFTPLPEIEFPYYFNAFTEDTGIEVNFVRLSAGETMARLLVEGDNATATVIFGGPNDTFVAMQREGLLYAYQSPYLSEIPEMFHDADGYWNPIYVGALAFASNTEWFEEQGIEIPTSWECLTNPELRGQITMAHPSTSGTAYTVLATIIKVFGGDEEAAWDYMGRLHQNIRHYTRVGAAPIREVAIGEAAVALVFAQDAIRTAEEGFPIAVTFPSEGTGYEVGAVAIIAGGFEHEKNAARQFIDWSMSVRGQELYIDSQSSRLPVNQNARYTPGLIHLEELTLVDYDAVWAGENRTRLVDEFMERISDEIFE